MSNNIKNNKTFVLEKLQEMKGRRLRKKEGGEGGRKINQVMIVLAKQIYEINKLENS